MAGINQNDEIPQPLYQQNEEARAWPFIYKFAKEKGVEWEPGSDIGTRGLLDLIWKASESASREKLESAEAEVARLRDFLKSTLPYIQCRPGCICERNRLFFEMRAALASPAQKGDEKP